MPSPGPRRSTRRTIVDASAIRRLQRRVRPGRRQGGPDDDHVRRDPIPACRWSRTLDNYAVAVLNDPLDGLALRRGRDMPSDSGAGTTARRRQPDGLRSAGGNDGTADLERLHRRRGQRTPASTPSTPSTSSWCPASAPTRRSRRAASPTARPRRLHVRRRGAGGARRPRRRRSTTAQAFQGKKVYGALYGPWITVLDPLGAGDNPRQAIPPTGHVMGVYARIETTPRHLEGAGRRRGPPARRARRRVRASRDADHTDLVKNGSVNGIRAMPRAGIVVDASRTLSTDTRWLLRQRPAAVQLRQEQPARRACAGRARSRTATRCGTRSSSARSRRSCWACGGRARSAPARRTQIFTVICDATNNPPDEVDQGNLKVEVYFYPSKPAETIVIIVGQQPSGAHREPRPEASSEGVTHMPQGRRDLREATAPTSSCWSSTARRARA